MFNKIDIQARAQMAADKEAFGHRESTCTNLSVLTRWSMEQIVKWVYWLNIVNPQWMYPVHIIWLDDKLFVVVYQQ